MAKILYILILIGWGAVYYFGGGYPFRSRGKFVNLFSLKMPLNASKVPKKLFNFYQNAQKISIKMCFEKVLLARSEGGTPAVIFHYCGRGPPPPAVAIFFYVHFWGV